MRIVAGIMVVGGGIWGVKGRMCWRIARRTRKRRFIIKGGDGFFIYSRNINLKSKESYILYIQCLDYKIANKSFKNSLKNPKIRRE